MGRIEHDGSSSTRPGVLEMTEMTTKNIVEGVTSTVTSTVQACSSVMGTNGGAQLSEVPRIEPVSRGRGYFKDIELIYIFIMILAVLVVAVTLGLVFGLREKDEIIYLPRATPTPSLPPIYQFYENRPTSPPTTVAPTVSAVPTIPPSFRPSAAPTTSSAPSPAPTATPTQAPTVSAPPTMAPTVKPTGAPTISAAPTLFVFHSDFLPFYTLDDMAFSNSPQSRAFEWLSSSYPVSALKTMSEKQKLQLMALATFYYEFDGPNWSEGWLDPTQSECRWKAGPESEASHAYGNYGFDTVCNANGDITAILLNNLSLQPQEPRLAKELLLLSSLQSIQLAGNNISTSFETMLSMRLIRLESLLDLSLQSNALTGTLPYRLKWFTSLKRLQVQNNQLTGSIATGLGALTHLEYLMLSNNSLTGVLPSELGRLRALRVLDISGNSIAGTIPEEVMALQTQNNLTIVNVSSS